MAGSGVGGDLGGVGGNRISGGGACEVCEVTGAATYQCPNGVKTHKPGCGEDDGDPCTDDQGKSCCKCPPNGGAEGTIFGTFLWDQNHNRVTDDGGSFMQNPDYFCSGGNYDLRDVWVNYEGPEPGKVLFNTSNNSVKACYADGKGKYEVTNLDAGSYVVQPVPPAGWYTVNGITDPDMTPTPIPTLALTPTPTLAPTYTISGKVDYK
jgi:hypothetical protein